MSTPPSTSVPPLPHDGLSLDERIRQAELRLIAREDNLRRRVDLLGHRLHEVTQPRRFIAPAIGAAVALLALWAMLRGRAQSPALRGAQSGQSRGTAPAQGSSEMPWLHLLALAWPMLPAPWRARVSPTTAATLVSLGLPLAERLLSARQQRPLPTAAAVDLARYAGTWHEIARLPEMSAARCAGQPSAHYRWCNGRMQVLSRCLGRDGRERVSRGTARVLHDSGNAKMQVAMVPAWLQWLPFVWADHWVLYVDEHYQAALVGDPSRRHLWLLSRRERMPPEQLAALMQFAAELEFPVQRLQVVQPD